VGPRLPAGDAPRLLGDRATRLHIELRTVESSLSVSADMHLPDIFLVESFFRRTMLEAELAFVTKLADDIASSSFSGTKVWRRLHELRAGGMTFAEILADPVGLLGEEARVLLPPAHSEERPPE